MLDKKTVSQCISSDYCRGWNDAVDTMPRWISVEERMPENEVSVIAFCTEDNHAWYAFRRGGLWWRPGDRVSIKIFGTVTHWMPLPEPPEVTKP